MPEPTDSEQAQLAAIRRAICSAVEAGETIRLPEFDPSQSRPSPLGAMVSVGIEPNRFGGTWGEYRYQFEGEEDLLHLMIVRLDGSMIDIDQASAVAMHLLSPLPPTLTWIKPAAHSHHVYVGHDDLISAWRGSL
ncbi:MAG: hypothetical protein ACK4XJ_07715 [Fimbriimonadaceae bacterium]